MSDKTAEKEFRTGYVAIVGRPNVGKSTLLNRLVGQKLSITSRKPQTTRQRITGIVTLDHAQILFVDTPGFQRRHASALNRSMNRSVTQALADVDAVLMVIEADHFSEEDREIMAMLPVGKPLLLAVNKTDRLKERLELLPFIEKVAKHRPFDEIIPVSASKGHAIGTLCKVIAKYLPIAPAIYTDDEITESSERFLAAELVREKLFRLLGDELPYICAVSIDRFVMEGRMRRISASIIVDKDSHKGIVVGAKGSRLREIGTLSRLDMEKLFDGKVHLELWVRVKGGWSDDERALKQLGYD
ncbi:MAG: GTPase Era [Betaproteobacteria bacterium]|jgi:GTP-binding protein Era|nr:GTPase Era [Betaproteobacteria bacterium]